MNQEEQALIKEAQRGNVLAFEALVRKYDKQVLQLAYSLVNDFQDAEDIYQEVFVKVYKNIGSFRFKSKFSTWIYRVVVNYCINFRKKKTRTKMSSVETEMENNPDSWKVNLKSNGIDPEKSILNQELSDQIDWALEHLSEQQKTVFVLRHYQGLKLQEIAEILHCAEGTVKNYLFRATHKMQTLLQGYVQI